MSNALAFATVTKALALLIAHNLAPEIDMAVSVETRKPPAEPPTEPTITVFLYQAVPNPSMRNNDLPTRSSNGTLLKRPAAALDLNYLISAYGDETELVGQRLIGCVVRTLHEIPILPRDVIEQAAQTPSLSGSDLAESPQKVRFSPIQMDIDETSKLWGMLHQTPYSLSVAYQGSLVLIEGREQPVPAKPVEQVITRALPFGAPGAPALLIHAEEAPAADNGETVDETLPESEEASTPEAPQTTSEQPSTSAAKKPRTSAAQASKAKRTTTKTGKTTGDTASSSDVDPGATGTARTSRPRRPPRARATNAED